MIAIDFLFYYLTYWFDKNKQNLSWSTPIQRTTYVVGLATMAILFAFNELLEFTVLKHTDFHISGLIFVVLGLCVIQVYDYIYIKRNRYEIINSPRFGKFSNISKSNGVVISIVLIILSLFTPFLMFMIFVPFGDHALK